MKISGVYTFLTIPKNLQVKSRPGYVSRIICRFLYFPDKFF